MQIGGKTNAPRKPTQPQFVVQRAYGVNEFAIIGEGIIWVGDPNSATKFDSKYGAKSRVREMADIPMTRCFKELEG